MQVQVQSQDDCRVHVSYVADPQKVVDKRNEVAQRLFKEVKNRPIPGFRPGKATLNVVKAHYKRNIEEMTKSELLQEAYDDVLFQTKMKPLFQPQVKNAWLNDSVFECNFLVLTKPEFELKQYKGFELPKPHMDRTVDEIVQSHLEQLRQEQGEMSPYGDGDFVQVGDNVTMDVKCEVDGNLHEQLSQEGMLYRVGGGYFQEFDDNVLGMNPGEERTFEVVTGAEGDQHRFKFTVNLHMGTKTVPCPLDDTLAQKLGLETFEELHQKLTGHISHQVNDEQNKRIHQQLVNRLLEANSFEAPSWLVSLETQEIARKSGVSLEALDDQTRVLVANLATKQVKLALILDAIREVEPESFFTDKEILEKIKENLTQSGNDAEKVLVEAQKNGTLKGMIASLQQEATMQWLLTQSTVVE